MQKPINSKMICVPAYIEKREYKSALRHMGAKLQHIKKCVCFSLILPNVIPLSDTAANGVFYQPNQYEPSMQVRVFIFIAPTR